MDKKREFVAGLIKERRRELQMTQQEFADSVGKDITTIQRWESGFSACEGPILRKVAEVLKLNLEDFSPEKKVVHMHAPPPPVPTDEIRELRVDMEWKFKNIENLVTRLASAGFASEKFSRYYMSDELFRDLIDKWEMFNDADRLVVKSVTYSEETLLKMSKAARLEKPRSKRRR